MRRILLVPVVATALLLITLSPPADAAVMCARKSRTGDLAEGASVRLRSACRATETQLDPDALALRGPQGPPGLDGVDGEPGPTGPAGPTGARGPGAVIKDANGAVVGMLEPVIVGTFGAELVVRSFMGTTATFGLDNEHIEGTVTSLLFADAACSGQPYIKDLGAAFGLGAAENLLAPYGTALGDGLLYYPIGESFWIGANSRLTAMGCELMAGSEKVFVPAVEDVSALAPPFRVVVE